MITVVAVVEVAEAEDEVGGEVAEVVGAVELGGGQVHVGAVGEVLDQGPGEMTVGQVNPNV